MSERQSRKMRKEQPIVKAKEKDSKKVLFNAISAIVIIAFLGLAAWAITAEIKGDTPVDNTAIEDQIPDTESGEQTGDTDTDENTDQGEAE